MSFTYNSLSHLPMQLKELLFDFDKDIGNYLIDLEIKNVVLKNYFYFTKTNFFKSNDLYSKNSLSLVLNLTDAEYAELVLKYFNKSTTVDTSSKVESLEAKLTKSREIEEAQKKLQEFNNSLTKNTALLESVNEIQSQYQEVYNEYQEISYLNKFDLNKIHTDLVEIMNQINHIENSIQEFKGIEIQEFSKKTSYDRGKVGLAIFIFSGIALLGAAGTVLQFPLWVAIAAWSIGTLLAAMIIFTARLELDYPLVQDQSEGEHVSIEYLKESLQELKSRRKALLDLVHVNSTDEFFNKKAKLGSFVKSLKYLQEQIQTILGDNNFELLQTERTELLGQIEKYQELTQHKEGVISPEEYLSIKREIDYLKMQGNSKISTQIKSKEDIIQQLSVIRDELVHKLPDFTALLKESFKTNFEEVKATYTTLCNQVMIQSSSFIDKEGNNFEQLSTLQLFIAEYALFKTLYRTSFVIAFEASEFKEEELTKLREIITQTNTNDCEFYALQQLSK